MNERLRALQQNHQIQHLQHRTILHIFSSSHTGAPHSRRLQSFPQPLDPLPLHRALEHDLLRPHARPPSGSEQRID